MRLPLVLAVLVVVCVLPAWALTGEQEAKLLASDGADDDRFGWAVALDGDTAVIGAYFDDDNGENSGSVYVFTRSAGLWTEQAKLLASDGADDDRFGWAVALDVDTALIGAREDDDNGENSGSVYVFTRSAGVWTEQAKLLASDGEELDSFGVSVALDGDTAIIGALGDDDNGFLTGAAYVFTRSTGAWTEQAKLLASDGWYDERFGSAVALDVDTALIGAPYDDDNGFRSGSAYVFTRTDGEWTEQAKLLPADGTEFAEFGQSVALVGDTAVIGAWLDDDNAPGSGSVYVFTRSAGAWTEQAKLLASDGLLVDTFGAAVALVGDTALIGAAYDDYNGWNSGSAYVFRMCDHRMTISTDAGDTLIFLTPDPGVFDVVTGSLSALLTDKDFSRAVCLVSFTGNPAVDSLPDPAIGDGRYYLGRPLRFCQSEGYGDSSLTPDPRDDLDLGPCP